MSVQPDELRCLPHGWCGRIPFPQLDLKDTDFGRELMRRIRRWLDEYPLLVLFLLGCGAFWLGSIPRHEPAKVEFNDETFQRIHWVYAVLVGLNTGVLIAHF